MSEEKPLRVQVAEALGWRDCKICPDHGEHWVGDAPVGDGWIRESHRMPLYDTDWAATGPLIERFSLGVMAAVEPGHTGETAHASTCLSACTEYCALPEMAGLARIKDMAMGPYRPFIACVDDVTPLRAVCVLIVALAAAGKI